MWSSHVKCKIIRQRWNQAAESTDIPMELFLVQRQQACLCFSYFLFISSLLYGSINLKQQFHILKLKQMNIFTKLPDMLVRKADVYANLLKTEATGFTKESWQRAKVNNCLLNLCSTLNVTLVFYQNNVCIQNFKDPKRLFYFLCLHFFLRS